MNKENLLKAADYIETIPQEKFDMRDWRSGQTSTHKCCSVGCILGHCTILDEKENVFRFKRWDGHIDFYDWAASFFSLQRYSDEMTWLFRSQWGHNNTDNTPTGAAKRIRHFVEHGLPENWREQMNGNAPLCYL